MYDFDMKTKGREIIKQIKQEKGTQSKTVSYRLPLDLAENFAKQCEKQGVSANAVVIRLIQGFLEDFK